MSNKSLFTVCGKLIQRLKISAFQNLSELEISLLQSKIIKVVAHNEGCSSIFIANEIFSDPAAVTRAIDSLIKKNYVVKKENQEDRRSWGIYLTPHGKKQVNEIEKCIEKSADNFFERLDANEKKQLEKIINKLLEE